MGNSEVNDTPGGALRLFIAKSSTLSGYYVASCEGRG